MCTVCGRPWSVCLNVCAVCTLRTVVQVHCVQFCDPCACSVLFSVMCSLCVERFYVYSGFACCGYFVCVCLYVLCWRFPCVLCVAVCFVCSVCVVLFVLCVLCAVCCVVYSCARCAVCHFVSALCVAVWVGCYVLIFGVLCVFDLCCVCWVCCVWGVLLALLVYGSDLWCLCVLL